MVSELERSLREKLAAAHHIIHYMGCDDLLATHLSVKIPGTNHILITPLDVPFEEVSASKIVKSDLDGNPIDANGYKIMEQAANIHTAVYKTNNAIMSIAHTHSIYGTAVSSLECGLLFINQHVLRFYNDVAYHEYNALALENEGAQIAAALDNKKVMILHNHGLLTIGESIEEAIYRMYFLERACEIQIKTQSTNNIILTIPDEVCQKTRDQFEQYLVFDSFAMKFNALVRRIENRSRVNFRD